jgi:hypothetical protein
MKAKLVKRSNGRFDLYKIEDVDQLNTIASSFDNPKGKLSLKNCQAIEHGYDLDELAEEWVFEKNSHKWSNNDDTAGDNYASFKEGFQKALKLMGDKKFSEGDIKKVVEISRQGSLQENHNGYGVSTGSIFVLDNLSVNEIIQSLRQTEWDVEIVTKRVIDKTKIIGAVKGVKGSGNKITTYKQIPKLDADGCLILKRI